MAPSGPKIGIHMAPWSLHRDPNAVALPWFFIFCHHESQVPTKLSSIIIDTWISYKYCNAYSFEVHVLTIDLHIPSSIAVEI